MILEKHNATSKDAIKYPSPICKMEFVINLAREALANGELPIAAAVFHGEKLISSAYTTERADKRWLVHAEQKALMDADTKMLSLKTRTELELYTNLEPCLMCLGMAISSFIGTINFSLEAPDDGAIDFYEVVFGGTNKKVMRLSEMPINPDFPISDNMKDWVAYAEIILRGTVFHFSDAQPDTITNGIISLMTRFDTIEALMETYDKLLDGGAALMEPAPQSYAKMFTWVRDKFGIDWQLICE